MFANIQNEIDKHRPSCLATALIYRLWSVVVYVSNVDYDANDAKELHWLNGDIRAQQTRSCCCCCCWWWWCWTTQCLAVQPAAGREDPSDRVQTEVGDTTTKKAEAQFADDDRRVDVNETRVCDDVADERSNWRFLVDVVGHLLASPGIYTRTTRRRAMSYGIMRGISFFRPFRHASYFVETVIRWFLPSIRHIILIFPLQILCKNSNRS